MKISEALREAAKVLEKRGFSPRITMRYGYCPTCFLGALDDVMSGNWEEAPGDMLERIIFAGDRNWFEEEYLSRQKWTTPDAVAACLIAADIAECEGK
jgi:hypothetical protein